MDVGIDKLHLWTRDFLIDDRSRLRVRPSVFDCNTGEMINDFMLFKTRNGDAVHGSNAFLNDDLFYADINIDGLRVNLNPSIVQYGNNFFSVDYNGLKETIKTVQSRLDDSGVNCELKDCDISRLDIQRTIPTEHIFLQYNPVFDFMKFGTMHDKKNHIDGYTAGNLSRQVCAYDKMLEMQRKKIDTSFVQDKNVMRFEYRFRNRRTVRTDCQVAKLRDLMRKDSFNNLSPLYKQNVESLFSEIPKESQIFCYETEVELLREMKRRYKRNAFYRYMISYAFDYWRRHLITPDVLKRIMRDADYDRGFIHKQMIQINKLRNVMTDSRRTDTTVYSLADEIRSKLVA